MFSRTVGSVLLALYLLGVVEPDPAVAAAAGEPRVVAQAEGTRDGGIEPRYQPREPEAPSAFNGDYVFAMTRGVADAPIAPAGQVALYVLTLPLDIAFLPFALLGGLFG